MKRIRLLTKKQYIAFTFFPIWVGAYLAKRLFNKIEESADDVMNWYDNKFL